MPKITITRSRYGVNWSVSADSSDDSPEASHATIETLAALDSALQSRFATTQTNRVSRETDQRPPGTWRSRRVYKWLLAQPNACASADNFWKMSGCGVPTFKWLCVNGYISHEGHGADAVFRALPAPH